jgi:hypothetical protein
MITIQTERPAIRTPPGAAKRSSLGGVFARIVEKGETGLYLGAN